MRLLRPRTARQWRWVRRSLVALAVGGLASIVLGRSEIGIAVFGVALLGLVLVEAAQLRLWLIESARQQHALLQIRPLLGELPLELGGWAADPVMAHNVVRLLTETRPTVVLECGSGTSTVIIARCLRALGRGRVISLEHDPAYAHRTVQLLNLHGLGDMATVVSAPLTRRQSDGKVLQWYGPEYELLLQEKIDVLLVDGPPGNSAPRARYPAVPLLRSHLAPECWILMDDGDRSDERAIAHAWSRELGATLSHLEGGRGSWLLHRSRNPSHSERPGQ